MENVRIVIADDNVVFCELLANFLKKYEDIEILAVVNSDDDEIYAIESLKPDIVITDLRRKNNKQTGVNIIKKYEDIKDAPDFLVITASDYGEIITNNLNVAAYMQKPFSNYEKIVEELRRIKRKKMQVLQINQKVIANNEKEVRGLLKRIFELLKIEKR